MTTLDRDALTMTNREIYEATADVLNQLLPSCEAAVIMLDGRDVLMTKGRVFELTRENDMMPFVNRKQGCKFLWSFTPDCLVHNGWLRSVHTDDITSLSHLISVCFNIVWFPSRIQIIQEALWARAQKPPSPAKTLWDHLDEEDV